MSKRPCKIIISETNLAKNLTTGVFDVADYESVRCAKMKNGVSNLEKENSYLMNLAETLTAVAF